MTAEQIKARANQWNDLQVLASDADLAGKPAEAERHRAQAQKIEQELEAAGTNIRVVVCL